jgi:hypothetical protein
MSQTVRKLANEPIIVAKFGEPFNAVQDGNTVATILQDALNNSDKTIYYVADMRDIKVQFADLVAGLAQAYSDKSSPYVNPRLKTFTVANDTLIALGTKAAAEQEQYGKAAVKLYATIEDALADVRRMMQQFN